MSNTAPLVIAGALIVGAVLLPRTNELEDEPMTFPSPIAVGKTSAPRIAELLGEMGQLFRAQGIDTDLVSPAEVTLMPKVGQVAIPPPSYWPRMARTLREVFIPLRRAMLVPLAVKGYRPPDYNRAVGGDPGSRHQSFEAIDIRVVGSSSSVELRRALAHRAAQLYRSRGAQLKMGLGIYGYPTPGNIHVDTGFRRRTWQDAQRFVNANIA